MGLLYPCHVEVPRMLTLVWWEGYEGRGRRGKGMSCWVNCRP